MAEPGVVSSVALLVWERLRGTSVEPLLEAEWVRERTSLVILDVGMYPIP